VQHNHNELHVGDMHLQSSSSVHDMQLRCKLIFFSPTFRCARHALAIVINEMCNTIVLSLVPALSYEFDEEDMHLQLSSIVHDVLLRGTLNFST